VWALPTAWSIHLQMVGGAHVQIFHPKAAINRRSPKRSTTRQDVKTAVGQAFQPDSEPGNVRLESLTYLIFWRVVEKINRTPAAKAADVKREKGKG